jgi:hypothetical protein
MKQILDGDFSLLSAQCSFCANYDIKTGPKCKAYPEGIPADIWDGERSHRDPQPGDHGIQYKSILKSKELN